MRDAAEYGGFVKNMSRDYYFSNIELDTKPEILIGVSVSRYKFCYYMCSMCIITAWKLWQLSLEC